MSQVSASGLEYLVSLSGCNNKTVGLYFYSNCDYCTIEKRGFPFQLYSSSDRHVCSFENEQGVSLDGDQMLVSSFSSIKQGSRKLNHLEPCCINYSYMEALYRTTSSKECPAALSLSVEQNTVQNAYNYAAKRWKALFKSKLSTYILSC